MTSDKKVVNFLDIIGAKIPYTCGGKIPLLHERALVLSSPSKGSHKINSTLGGYVHPKCTY